MTSVGDKAEEWRRLGMGCLLLLLYIFLYAPILYVVYASFSEDIVWPFPPSFTTAAYAELFDNALYADALHNSLLDRFWQRRTVHSLATAGVIGILRFPSRRRVLVLIAFLAPLFVAELLIGISSLAFNARVLGLPGNLASAIAANAVEGVAFAFLIILAQLVRYDWQMDDAAMVFGASPMRCFWEVTLPTIWPSLLGAFLITFILAFNNLEISFYNLGAIPTLPSVAWGSLAIRTRTGAIRACGFDQRPCLHRFCGDVWADAHRDRQVRLSRRLRRGACWRGPFSVCIGKFWIRARGDVVEESHYSARGVCVEFTQRRARRGRARGQSGDRSIFRHVWLAESLVHRVVMRESKYNPKAYHSGHWGLMQIGYDTARVMGYRGRAKGLLEVDANLKYGVKYLAGAYLVSGGNADKALRYYRSGYYYIAKRKGLLEETGLKTKR